MSDALSLAEVAFASGYSSVRRFNAAFRGRFGRPPSSFRKPGPRGAPAEPLPITIALGYREPIAWPELLSFFGLIDPVNGNFPIVTP